MFYTDKTGINDRRISPEYIGIPGSFSGIPLTGLFVSGKPGNSNGIAVYNWKP